MLGLERNVWEVKYRQAQSQLMSRALSVYGVVIVVVNTTTDRIRSLLISMHEFIHVCTPTSKDDRLFRPSIHRAVASGARPLILMFFRRGFLACDDRIGKEACLPCFCLILSCLVVSASLAGWLASWLGCWSVDWSATLAGWIIIVDVTSPHLSATDEPC